MAEDKKPCPSCGHCPTCGKRPSYPSAIWIDPRVWPTTTAPIWWQQPNNTITYTSTTTSSGV